MDTRNGRIYDSEELALADRVPRENLITGTREALKDVRKRLVFTKGSFKPVAAPAKDEPSA